MEKEKLSDLVNKQETLYIFGGFTIKDGIGRNRLWLENSIGEGGDFPTKDILELLMPKLDTETIEEKLEEYFNTNF